jgi:hypothetical protein
VLEIISKLMALHQYSTIQHLFADAGEVYLHTSPLLSVGFMGIHLCQQCPSQMVMVLSNI